MPESTIFFQYHAAQRVSKESLRNASRENLDFRSLQSNHVDGIAIVYSRCPVCSNRDVLLSVVFGDKSATRLDGGPPAFA